MSAKIYKFDKLKISVIITAILQKGGFLWHIDGKIVIVENVKAWI